MSVPNAWTPGPWSYCSCGCGFIGGGDDEVATVTIGKWGDEGVNIFTGKRELVHHWGTVPAERAHANAHLIAAAPELYEALEVATHLLDRYRKETPLGHQPHMIAHSAEAAVNVGTALLAKARGESPHNQSNPKVGA